jgi:hypothetical protein
MRSSYDSYHHSSSLSNSHHNSSPSHSLDLSPSSGSERAEFRDRYQNRVRFYFEPKTKTNENLIFV